jgi:hypothetical protein
MYIGGRGEGLFLARNASQLEEKVGSETHGNVYVVQEYVHPPHLLHGKHKYHLRLYMVVSSLDPLVIHLHRDGLVLVAPDEYSTDVAFDADMAKHLSNSNVRIKFEQEEQTATPRFTLQEVFGLMEKDGVNAAAVWEEVHQMAVKTVLNIRGSGKHVLKTHSCTRSGVEPKQCHDVEECWATIVDEKKRQNLANKTAYPGDDARLQHHCCLHAKAEASAGGLDGYTGSRCFDFWGLDVMFDASWKPYMLEVNLGPNLFYHDYHQQLVAAQVLDDLFETILPDGTAYAPKAMATFDRLLLRFQQHHNLSHCKDLGISYRLLRNQTCGNCDAKANEWGPGGERWQTATRGDVKACKDTCGAHADCGAFAFVESHRRCYFRANDGACGQEADLDRDCYLKTGKWTQSLRNLRGEVNCLTDKDEIDLWHLHLHLDKTNARKGVNRGFDLSFPTLGTSLNKLKPFFDDRMFEHKTNSGADNATAFTAGRSNDLAILWLAFMV